jgi:hypothetical protein
MKGYIPSNSVLKADTFWTALVLVEPMSRRGVFPHVEVDAAGKVVRLFCKVMYYQVEMLIKLL